MGVTQRVIAQYAGIDVSSVNKIINKIPGPSFKRETIDKVFEIANKLGYDFKSNRAARCRTVLRELIEGGHLVGLSARKMREYKKLAGVA